MMATSSNNIRQECPLEARGLSLSFDGQNVLEDVDLGIRIGSVVLLRGGNGAGKTCLIDILTGALEPTTGVARMSRNGRATSFRFPSRLWRRWLRIRQSHPEFFARFGIGRSWQDIRLFDSLTVGDNLVMAHRSAGESLWRLFTRPHRVLRDEMEARRRSHVLLKELSLENFHATPARNVSHGQGRRLAISRSIIPEPSVLFLDEPLAGLDAVGAREVIELIRRLAMTRRVALVIVEHIFNVPWLLDLATDVWTIRDRHIVVESPSNLHQESTQDADETVTSWVHWIIGCVTHDSCVPLPRNALLRVVLSGATGTGKPVLEVDDLIVRRGGRIVVGQDDQNGEKRGVSFDLRKGELAILTAPNGWGKTTLAEAIGGLIPSNGKVRIGGLDLTGSATWKRAKAGLAFLQSRNNTFGNLTVQQVLRIAGMITPTLVNRSLYNRRVNSLSGGERQLLAIETVLARASNSKVLILDEPFQALDESTIHRVCARLAQVLPSTAILITMPRPLGGRPEASVS
jgi:ABC-type branched-subunit amino acid transport system ATPase component